MDATGGHHVKRSKLGSETQKMHVFSHMWKIDPKINIHTKTSIIMYKLRYRTCWWNYSMELRERGKGKENDRASVIT
jgi:hypothetical protein